MDTKVQQKILSNGINIFLLPRKNTKILYVQVSSKYGENMENSPGIVHLFEHLISFFTSKKYPNANKNSQYLDQEALENNASTDDEQMSLWIKGLSTHHDLMLDLIVNVLLHPQIDATKLKQEKNAVRQELKNEISDTWYDCNTLADKWIYKGTNQSISTRKILKNVDKITLRQLNKLRNYIFDPRLLVIFIAGDLPQKKLKSFYKKLQTRKSPNIPLPIQKQVKNRPWGKVFTCKNKNSHALIMIFFDINISRFDIAKDACLECINFLLADGMSSRLYKELRLVQGEIYNVDVEVELDYLGPKGSFIKIETKCDSKKVSKVINTIIRILSTFNPTTKEMNRWKESIKFTKNEWKLDIYPSSYVEGYEPYLLWGKFVTFKQIIAARNAVTKKDIKNQIKQLSNPIIIHS